jgi:hypothetical protein
MPTPVHVNSRPQDRYSNLLDDVFFLFSSEEWKAENFLVVPAGYVSDSQPAEFARFEIVTDGASLKDSLKGILYFNISTSNGVGPKRAYQVADLLDKYLAGSSFSTQGDKAVTQFRRESNFALMGNSQENSSFLRSTYQIQFSHFRKET